MNDFDEEPFQMDEDMGDPCGPRVPTSISNVISAEVDDPLSKHLTDRERSVVRSEIARLKLEETIAANNTTEEDDVYEEDVDDKLDPEAQKHIEQEYETMQNNDWGGSSDDRKRHRPELTPPENFAPVINTIYRSSFPQPTNFEFLTTLKLKSVLCLIPEEYPELHRRFLQEQGIKLFQLGMSGNKEPFVKISGELITEAIKIVINPANQPILIHCNRGKHRTGCLVGVLRRLQKWSLTIIFDEYRKFAAPKERPMDQQFIELYDEREIVQYAQENEFLPLRWN
ncbi:Tyrosine-protein phosphatase domain-containing protein [[Candida] zeylanoides]